MGEIRNFKLFLRCVESMRTAQKEYENNKTDSNKGILKDLQNRVDLWINWFNQKEENVFNTPHFIGKTKNNYQGIINQSLFDRLKESHTPEEMERFAKMLQGTK